MTDGAIARWADSAEVVDGAIVRWADSAEVTDGAIAPLGRLC